MNRNALALILVSLAWVAFTASLRPGDAPPQATETLNVSEIKARRMVLLDDASKERVVIEVQKGGDLQGPVIQMTDRSGKACFRVARCDGYSEMTLRDARGGHFLVHASPETCSLSVERKQVLYFSTGRSGKTGWFRVAGAAGSEIRGICAEHPSGPVASLWLETRSGEEHALLRAGVDQESSLSLMRNRDEAGVRVVSAPSWAWLELDGKKQKRNE